MRGFTLIELMIVVGIIGIMISVAASFVMNKGDSGRDCIARCRPHAVEHWEYLDGKLQCHCDITTEVR